MNKFVDADVCCVHKKCFSDFFFLKHTEKTSVKITSFLGSGVRLFQKQNLLLEVYGSFEAAMKKQKMQRCIVEGLVAICTSVWADEI